MFTDMSVSQDLVENFNDSLNQGGKTFGSH